MKIPKTVYAIRSNILFVGGLVLFVLFFAITYTPGYGLNEETTGVGDWGNAGGIIRLWYSHQSLCLPVCCAIVLGATTLSRTLLLLTTRTARIREGEYLLWQLGEVAFCSLFLELFLSLYLHFNYISCLPQTLLVYLSVAVYPYAIYWLLAERLDRDMRIAEAQRTIVRLRQGEEAGQSGMLRFADEKGVVKLVVSTADVVCIEAAGNYVTILHRSGGRPVRYSLRNTLKGIEPVCAEGPLVRCHRSWYVNLDRVRLLRKTSDGLRAELDCEGVADIPVSKSYAAEVTQRFADNK